MPDPSVRDHRDRILAAVTTPLAPELVPLAEAAGRVLAADVVADASVPPFDHSAMDGFAVRALDVATVPLTLPVTGVIAAGDVVDSARELAPGTAIRIMTGAALPPGADLVIPFEWTSGADPVRIEQTTSAGRHVRRAGEDVLAGSVAVPAGTRLGPAHLGLLTSVGAVEVLVRARPRLGVVSTGAELVNGQVPDSNTALLVAAGRGAGALAQGHGPASDDPEEFRALLLAAAAVSDVVVTTGGVSAGDHDVVKAALGGEDGFWFGTVAMKPGRPQGTGVITTGDGRRIPVVSLPGTPVAAAASFLLYVVPLLAAVAGRPWTPRTAQLAHAVDAGDRTVLLPASYDAAGGVSTLPGHAGHSQRILASAEALIVVPPAGRLVPAGTLVEVLSLHPEEVGHG